MMVWSGRTTFWVDRTHANRVVGYDLHPNDQPPHTRFAWDAYHNGSSVVLQPGRCYKIRIQNAGNLIEGPDLHTISSGHEVPCPHEGLPVSLFYDKQDRVCRPSYTLPHPL